MPYVDRDGSGKIISSYARPQKRGHEYIDKDSVAFVAFKTQLRPTDPDEVELKRINSLPTKSQDDYNAALDILIKRNAR